ncbi:MAG: Rrf2 family transcriptional regulator [Planctomycetota bacterium]|nr:MAG: Rrf2 family transcriptional regulator [Planctomycetota bacterium]
MISSTAEYALRAMSWLALTPDERVASSALAEKTLVPVDYLAKVLQLLGDAGFIEGRRGVRGGYRLAKPAGEIRLLDIVNAVSRNELQLKPIEACPLGIKSHGAALCPLHRTMDRAIAAVMDVLGDRTLADLVSEEDAPTPLCESRAGIGVSVKRT